MDIKGFETKSANGRPAGTPEFIAMDEAKLGRNLRLDGLGQNRATARVEEMCIVSPQST